MQSILQLYKPWKLVAMDFIVKLLRLRNLISSKEYNSIFIITNQLIKEAKFMPFNKAINTPETAHIIMREMVAIKSLLDKWITNRDLKFISYFWQTLIARLGVKHNVLMAYY
jgi:hypothetical protein